MGAYSPNSFGIEKFSEFLARDPNRWIASLNSYSWKGSDLVCGICTRFRFHERLKKSLKDKKESDFGKIVNDILEWGGIGAEFSIEDLEKIHLSVNSLVSIPVDNNTYSKLFVGSGSGSRIASVSKIYEMSNPRLWTIYDSRLGAALCDELQQFHDEAAIPEADRLVIFVPPPRPDNLEWNNHEGLRRLNTSNQARHSFFMASEILRKTVELLNAGKTPPPVVELRAGVISDPTWQVYHLEMALFMLGGEVISRLRHTF